MNSLSSIRHARSSLLRCCDSLKWVSQFSSTSGGFPGGFNDSFPAENLSAAESPGKIGAAGTNMGSIKNSNQNFLSQYPLNFQGFLNSERVKKVETGSNARAMKFLKGVIENDGRNLMGFSQQPRSHAEQNADFVHIKLLRNNTFVTVTDSKGNIKCRASSGCVPELKGGRYNAEATAEHVGRMAKKMGLKSVVVKVNGFTYFKKKKQAILSFRDGYTNSRVDQNPIVHIEDTTQRPHNGCRLRKKRRI